MQKDNSIYNKHYKNRKDKNNKQDSTSSSSIMNDSYIQRTEQQYDTFNKHTESYNTEMNDLGVQHGKVGTEQLKGRVFEVHHKNDLNAKISSKPSLFGFEKNDYAEYGGQIDPKVDIKVGDNEYQFKAYKNSSKTSESFAETRYDDIGKVTTSDQVEGVKIHSARRASQENLDTAKRTSHKHTSENVKDHISDNKGNKSDRMTTDEARQTAQDIKDGKEYKNKYESSNRKNYENNARINDFKMGFLSASIDEVTNLMFDVKNGNLTKEVFTYRINNFIKNGTIRTIKNFGTRKLAEKVGANKALFAVNFTIDISEGLFDFAKGNIDGLELMGKITESGIKNSAGVVAGEVIGGIAGAIGGPAGVVVGQVIGIAIVSSVGKIINNAKQKGIDIVEKDYEQFLANLENGNIHKAIDTIGTQKDYSFSMWHLIPTYGIFSQIGEYSERKKHLVELQKNLEHEIHLLDRQKNQIFENYKKETEELESLIKEQLTIINENFNVFKNDLISQLTTYNDINKINQEAWHTKNFDDLQKATVIYKQTLLRLENQEELSNDIRQAINNLKELLNNNFDDNETKDLGIAILNKIVEDSFMKHYQKDSNAIKVLRFYNKIEV